MKTAPMSKVQEGWQGMPSFLSFIGFDPGGGLIFEALVAAIIDTQPQVPYTWAQKTRSCHHQVLTHYQVCIRLFSL